jgi:thioredoxin 1
MNSFSSAIKYSKILNKNFAVKSDFMRFLKFNRFSFAEGKSANVLEIKSAEEFESLVKKSSDPLVVDFYANWCGPCRMLAPVLEQKLKAKENVKLVKVNVDDHPELAEQFNVMGIPHVILFKNGAKSSEFSGFNERKLDEMLKLI